MAGTVEMIPFVFEQLCGETVIIRGLDKQPAGRFTKGKYLFNGLCRIGDMFDTGPASNQVKGVCFKGGRENIALKNLKTILPFSAKHGIFGNIHAIDEAMTKLPDLIEKVAVAAADVEDPRLGIQPIENHFGQIRCGTGFQPVCSTARMAVPLCLMRGIVRGIKLRAALRNNLRIHINQGAIGTLNVLKPALEAVKTVDRHPERSSSGVSADIT
jgi:hypothetical protein